MVFNPIYTYITQRND